MDSENSLLLTGCQLSVKIRDGSDHTPLSFNKWPLYSRGNAPKTKCLDIEMNGLSGENTSYCSLPPSCPLFFLFLKTLLYIIAYSIPSTGLICNMQCNSYHFKLMSMWILV